MKQNNIYLVGFMGSGKTSILKKIKQMVNANTIDLDENIEKKYGSINKIFQTQGEKYFRNIELKTFETFGRGWTRRVNETTESALKMI